MSITYTIVSPQRAKSFLGAFLFDFWCNTTKREFKKNCLLQKKHLTAKNDFSTPWQREAELRAENISVNRIHPVL